MSETTQQFIKRKQDHIRLALDENTQASGFSGLDTIQLIHEAVPDMDFADIDISTTVFGKPLATPFLVSSMTAGHDASVNINQILALASQQRGWLMGVGSQRRQLFDMQAEREWSAIRKTAPAARLLGNIGLSQLIHTPIKQILKLADTINAEAMIIHTNPLQEVLQIEGTPNFKGSYQALEQLSKEIPIPVVVKETGCGFSKQTLLRLNNIGIAVLDISGFGGTHWGRIEGRRNEVESLRHLASITFKNWGISTVQSLLDAVSLKPNYTVWASGGVRSGLDAAKLLAIGAHIVGFAKPLMEAALQDFDTVMQLMERYEFELRIALFCTGCRNIAALQENIVWQLTK